MNASRLWLPDGIEPAGSAEPRKERTVRERVRYTWRRLWPYARPHRRWLISGMAGTLLVVACRLAFPWPLRGVLELAFEREGSTSDVASLVPSFGDPVLWLGGAFVFVVLLQGFAELLQRVSFARFSIGTFHDARSAAVAMLSTPEPEGEPKRDPGDMISRVIGDSARAKAGVKGVLIRMTQNGCFFVGVVIALLLIHPPLGLVFLTGGVVIVGISLVGATRSNRISRRLRKNEGKLAGRMHRLLSGIAQDEEELEAAERKSSRAEAKTQKLEGLTIWGVHATLAATVCAVLVVGLAEVRAERLEPAAMFTVLFYVIMVHNPTVRLGRQTVRLGRVLASAERLAKILKKAERGASVTPADNNASPHLVGVVQAGDR